MYQIELEGKGGVVSFPFPEQPSEILLKNFIEFEKAFDAHQKWLEQMEGVPVDDVGFMLEYIRQIMNLVGCIIGEDAAPQVPLGNFHQHLANLVGAGDLSQVDLKGVKNTLFALYVNIWMVLKKYKPRVFLDNDFTFTHKGEQFYIGRSFKDAVTKQEVFETTPTIQVVESLEAWRLFEKQAEKDEGGSFLYTTILKLIACLARKKGHQFPRTDSEAERHINEMLVFFADIDMQTALDVRNFFFSYIKSLKANERLRWFFKPPQRVGKNIDEQRAISEHESRNRNLFNRVGYRYIYHRVESSGKFTGLAETPSASVRLAPFEDVVAAISIENALAD